MKPTSIPALLWLGALAQISLAQENSEIFSQYFGAPTVSPTFNGPSASYQSDSFTICTNYGHGLQVLSALPTSISIQIEQLQADAVCGFCSSLELSRIDSCCGQATSVSCFAQFAAAATTAPASTTLVTTSAGASTPTSTSASIGHRYGEVSSQRPLLAETGTNISSNKGRVGSPHLGGNARLYRMDAVTRRMACFSIPTRGATVLEQMIQRLESKEKEGDVEAVKAQMHLDWIQTRFRAVASRGHTVGRAFE